MQYAPTNEWSPFIASKKPVRLPQMPLVVSAEHERASLSTSAWRGWGEIDGTVVHRLPTVNTIEGGRRDMR